MKKLIVSISLIFAIAPLAFAQPRPVVSADMMNVLYAGVENPISVAVPGQLPQNLQISCATATVVKKDDVHFIVSPEEGSRQAELRIFSFNGVDTVHLGQTFFRVQPGPEPSLILGNIELKDGENFMSKGLLISTPVLILRYSVNFPVQLQSPLVVSYKVSFPDSPAKSELQVNGSRLNEEALSLVKAAGPGDKIIFSEIKMSRQGQVRQLGSYVVVLK